MTEELIAWLRDQIAERERWAREHDGQYAADTSEARLVKALRASAEADRKSLDWIEGELADDPSDKTLIWMLKVRAKAYAASPGYRKEWRP